MKAIIVEDEKRARGVIRNLLSKMDIPVSVAGEADNAAEGIRLIQTLLPDIVFADIRMPEMSGIEMIQRLNEKGVQTKYVIVSGFDDFKYAQRCIELGVMGYILKPVTYEDMEQVILKVYGSSLGSSIPPGMKKNLPVLDVQKLEYFSDNLIIKKVIRYVSENMGVPCRLSQTAGELKISPEHLSRVFHEEMNMTFTDYVKLVKLDYSMALLKKTDLKINEIARAVGYENEKYFSNIFKETVGITPKQYRNIR